MDVKKQYLKLLGAMVRVYFLFDLRSSVLLKKMNAAPVYVKVAALKP